MTLIDDTCDGCGRWFDPMGDPLLERHPEISAWAVYCGSCERRHKRDAWLADASERHPGVSAESLAAIYDDLDR